MSGDTNLLAAAADNIEEYCRQITECEDCRIRNMCETLDRSIWPPTAMSNRIRKAAEE